MSFPQKCSAAQHGSVWFVSFLCLLSLLTLAVRWGWSQSECVYIQMHKVTSTQEFDIFRSNHDCGFFHFGLLYVNWVHYRLANSVPHENSLPPAPSKTWNVPLLGLHQNCPLTMSVVWMETTRIIREFQMICWFCGLHIPCQGGIFGMWWRAYQRRWWTVEFYKQAAGHCHPLKGAYQWFFACLSPITCYITANRFSKTYCRSGTFFRIIFPIFHTI